MRLGVALIHSQIPSEGSLFNYPSVDMSIKYDFCTDQAHIFCGKPDGFRTSGYSGSDYVYKELRERLQQPSSEIRISPIWHRMVASPPRYFSPTEVIRHDFLDLTLVFTSGSWTNMEVGLCSELDMLFLSIFVQGN